MTWKIVNEPLAPFEITESESGLRIKVHEFDTHETVLLGEHNLPGDNQYGFYHPTTTLDIYNYPILLKLELIITPTRGW